MAVVVIAVAVKACGFPDDRGTQRNLYSITTNQAAIAALFGVINRYVGNLPPVPGVFPDYPAPVIPNTESPPEMTIMRSGTLCHRAVASPWLHGACFRCTERRSTRR